MILKKFWSKRSPAEQSDLEQEFVSWIRAVEDRWGRGSAADSCEEAFKNIDKVLERYVSIVQGGPPRAQRARQAAAGGRFLKVGISGPHSAHVGPPHFADADTIFFPESDKNCWFYAMHFAACFYPENWPRGPKRGHFRPVSSVFLRPSCFPPKAPPPIKTGALLGFCAAVARRCCSVPLPHVCPFRAPKATLHTTILQPCGRARFVP